MDAEIKYDFINRGWSGNVKLDGSVEVEPYAGAGVETWLSVGVYGQAKLGIRITLLTFIPPTNEKGVDDIYLSGETGLKGYFAKKEVKVPLLSLKNLKKTDLGKYINKDNELLIYSRKENSLINKKSARSTEIMNGSVADLQYIYLPEMNQSVLVFNRNGAVEYIKTASDEPITLLEEGTMDSESRFVMLGDKFYFLKTMGENSRNLCCASYAGGHWGSVALTDETAYIDAFSVSDDKLIYLLTHADFGENGDGDSELITSSEIKFLSSTEAHDLKMENVEFDALNIKAGEDLDLTLLLKAKKRLLFMYPIIAMFQVMPV